MSKNKIITILIVFFIIGNCLVKQSRLGIANIELPDYIIQNQPVFQFASSICENRGRSQVDSLTENSGNIGSLFGVFNWQPLLKASGMGLDSISVKAAQKVLQALGFIKTEDYNKLISEVLNELNIKGIKIDEQVHIVRGPPDAIPNWDKEKEFVTFLKDEETKELHTYIHESFLNPSLSPEKQKTKLMFALTHEYLESTGMSHDNVVEAGFGIDILNKQTAQNISDTEIQNQIKQNWQKQAEYFNKLTSSHKDQLVKSVNLDTNVAEEKEKYEILELNVEKVKDLTQKNSETNYGMTIVAGHPLGGNAYNILKKWQDEILMITKGKLRINIEYLHTTIGAIVRSQPDPIRETTFSNIDFNKILNAIKHTQPYTIYFREIKLSEGKEGNIVLIGEAEEDGLIDLKKEFQNANMPLKWKPAEKGKKTKVFLTLGHISDDLIQKLTIEEIARLKEWIYAHSTIENEMRFKVDTIKIVNYSQRMLESMVTPDIDLPLGKDSGYSNGENLRNTIIEQIRANTDQVDGSNLTKSIIKGQKFADIAHLWEHVLQWPPGDIPCKMELERCNKQNQFSPFHKGGYRGIIYR